MDLMRIRRIMMDQNLYTPSGVVAYRPNNNSVVADANSITITALGNSYAYGAAHKPLSTLNLVSGRRYVIYAKVGECFGENLTAAIKLRNSSNSFTGDSSNEVSNPTAGDSVKLVFTYDPSNQTNIVFMIGVGVKAANQGDFIKFTDIYIG